ncbi:MAG: hypothetical protein ACRC5T_12045 [Cetobacterium sp.]
MYQLVLLGEIASGKDYLLKRITDEYDLSKVVTTTTRPMRDGEVDGETYHFVSEERFKIGLEDGDYIEHQVYKTVHGEWFYGTTLDSVNKDNTVIILDKDGYFEYKKHMPYCISIFISCIDETERFYRGMKRLGNIGNKDLDEIYRRIKTDEEKFKDIDRFVDFVLPQTYSDTSVELVFDLLNRLGFEKRGGNNVNN